VKTPTLSREPAFPDLEKRAALELGERFRLDGLLGRGPQSLVFRAVPASSPTPVALKVVPKGTHDAAFLRSASTAAEMEHPHVVPILQAGQTKHLLWYTMPLLEDPSLDRVISGEGRLEVKRCLRIVEQIASALQYGHRRGVPHGGIKPENVFVNPAGWTLLSDFGLPNSVARVADGTLPDRLHGAVSAGALPHGAQLPGGTRRWAHARHDDVRSGAQRQARAAGPDDGAGVPRRENHGAHPGAGVDRRPGSRMAADLAEHPARGREGSIRPLVRSRRPDTHGLQFGAGRCRSRSR